jgi:hypothetical protein
MLEIGEEQLESMAQGDNAVFISFIIEHLRSEHYDYVSDFPNWGLREMVEVGLKKARQHGFKSTEDLVAFVVLMFTMAPNFDEQSDLAAVLADETIPEDKRMDALTVDSLNTSWEEAENAYDESAWFPDIDEESEG